MVSGDSVQESGLRGFVAALDRSWDSLLGKVWSDDMDPGLAVRGFSRKVSIHSGCAAPFGFFAYGPASWYKSPYLPAAPDGIHLYGLAAQPPLCVGLSPWSSMMRSAPKRLAGSEPRPTC
jgi:hypothetical protein